MSLDLTMTTPTPVRMPAPQMIADKRPTADAAAMARNPRPETPMALPAVPPPSATQKAEVNRSLMGTTVIPGVSEPNAVTPAERVLKPFGVTMLPHRAPDSSAGNPAAGEAGAAPPEAAAAEGSAAETTEVREGPHPDDEQAGADRH